MKDPKFLLTENLNKLAKFLRFMGYDAAVYKSISFDNMIRIAEKDKRIILTRSVKQSKSKKQFRRIFIKSDNHISQIKELKDVIRYNEDNTFTRCGECNKKLFEIIKTKVKGLVPEFVFETQTEFKICRYCGKFFWKGTHYKEIQRDLAEIFFH
jgi:uncharacterized protein